MMNSGSLKFRAKSSGGDRHVPPVLAMTDPSRCHCERSVAVSLSEPLTWVDRHATAHDDSILFFALNI